MLKRWPLEWEKMFLKHISYEDLISRKYKKNSYNSMTKRHTTLLKMGKGLEYVFFQRGYTNGQ